MTQADTAVDSAVIFRPATEDDHPFILNSWVRSYADSWLAHPTGMTTDELRVFSGLRGDSAERAAKAFYERHQRAKAVRLLGDWMTVVACLDDQPDEIIGWSCYDVDRHRERPTLAYIYVKAIYRGNYMVLRGLMPSQRPKHESRRNPCVQNVAANEIAKGKDIVANAMRRGCELTGRHTQNYSLTKS